MTGLLGVGSTLGKSLFFAWSAANSEWPRKVRERPEEAKGEKIQMGFRCPAYDFSAYYHKRDRRFFDYDSRG